MALGGRTVTAPDGSVWHVGRQWLPWTPRRRGPDVDASGMHIGDAGGDDIVGVIIAVLAVVTIVILLFTVVIPLVALALEIILLLLVLVWGIGTRVVLRRPWTVRARQQDGTRELVFKAKGYLRSGRVRDEVAEAIARGEAAPRPAEALPA
jgi:hypothetical protein